MTSLVPGQLRTSLDTFMTIMHTEHPVEEDQFEPGIPPERQARRHILDFAFIDVNLRLRLDVLEWLALRFELPIRTIVQRADFEDARGEPVEDFNSIHHRDETIVGPGDLMLGARLRVLQPTDELPWIIDLLAGVSLPTGSIEPDPFALGRQGEPHQHMFTGTGTVDPRGGLETTFRWDAASLVGFVNMGGALYANRYGFRRGLLVSSGLGVRTSFGLEDWSFLLQQEVFHEEPSQWENEPAENSGRTDLIATAAVSWRFAPQWRSRLLLKVPFYTHAEGGQLSIPVALGFGVSWTTELYGGDDP